MGAAAAGGEGPVRTFTAAHVDDHFQGGLLRHQQCLGLSQLPVGGLEKDPTTNPQCLGKYHCMTFLSQSLLDGFCPGNRAHGAGVGGRVLRGSTKEQTPPGTGERTRRLGSPLAGQVLSTCCSASWRDRETFGACELRSP